MLESGHFLAADRLRVSPRKSVMEKGITSKDGHKPISLGPLMAAGLLAGAGSGAANLVVAALASAIFTVPIGFRPFAALPIFAASMGGSLGAAGLFSLIDRATGRPKRYFNRIVLVVLALSFVLPASLVGPSSPGSTGISWAVASALMLMHTIVGLLSVRTINRL